MPPISLGRNFNTADIDRRIKDRTRILDHPNIFVVYAWDKPSNGGNDGIFEPRQYHTEADAWNAAREMAIEFPTWKVTIYRLCVTIDPDKDGTGPYMPQP